MPLHHPAYRARDRRQMVIATSALQCVAIGVACDFVGERVARGIQRFPTVEQEVLHVVRQH